MLFARSSRWCAFAASLVGASIVCAGACERATAPSSEPSLEQLLPGAFGTAHYGYFVFGKRIGWARLTLHRVEPGGEYVVERTSHFDLLADGQPSRSQHRERYRYASEAPHRLLFAESTEVEDGATTVSTLSAGEHGLELRTLTGGEESRLTVRPSAANLRDALDAMRHVLDGQPGDTAAYSEFEFDSGRDERITLRHAGRSIEVIDGADVELTQIDMSSDATDGRSLMLVSSDGGVVLMRAGNTTEVRRMDETAATAQAEALDTLVAFAVPLEGFEDPVSSIGRLELEWSGSEALLPERDYQHARWERENELQIVALEHVQPPTATERALPIPDAVAVELAPDPLCESDHPRLRETAREATAGYGDAWDRTVSIVLWMHVNLARSVTSNRSTALGALEARAGDCSEHTLLACALLRASGVPTRRVAGVACVGSAGEPRLSPHAWIEVWVGRWIPIDPTWKQAPADALHVCFGGERDSRIDDSGLMRARVRKIERR